VQDWELDLNIAERIRRREATKSADEQDGSQPCQEIADFVLEARSSATTAPNDGRECESEGPNQANCGYHRTPNCWLLQVRQGVIRPVTDNG